MLRSLRVVRAKACQQLTLRSQFAFAELNAKSCFYELLKVKPNADEMQIKKAYLSLARKYHPDHNTEDPHAEENFKILSKAYQVLKDPVSRQVYDMNKSDPGSAQAWTENTNYGTSEYSNSYYSNLKNSQKGQTRAEYRGKVNQETSRDEYTQMRDRLSEKSFFNSKMFRIAVVLVVIIGYDIQHNALVSSHSRFRNTQREIMEAGSDIQVEESLKNYIENRQVKVAQKLDAYHHTY